MVGETGCWPGGTACSGSSNRVGKCQALPIADARAAQLLGVRGGGVHESGVHSNASNVVERIATLRMRFLTKFRAIS